ncbi:MAG: hypothetical protein RMI91_01270 [Gemmatales bacterium]|nr:hypothetical protein [Gemmatales bacterium]MDW7993263.1 hypothetical protein [Gemmatales bacterium]
MRSTVSATAWPIVLMGLLVALCRGFAPAEVGKRQATACNLTPETRLVFTRRIQPIVFNCCSSQACHGRPGSPGLTLKTPAQPGQLTPFMTEHNLERVLSLISLDKPEESPLLRYALQPHGGSNRPPLPSRQAPAYRVLEEWVFAVAGREPPSMAVSSRQFHDPSAQLTAPKLATGVATTLEPSPHQVANPDTMSRSSTGPASPNYTVTASQGGAAMPVQVPSPANGPMVVSNSAPRSLMSIGRGLRAVGPLLPGQVVGSSTQTTPNPTASPLPHQVNTGTSPVAASPFAPPTNMAPHGYVAPPVPAYVPKGSVPRVQSLGPGAITSQATFPNASQNSPLPPQSQPALDPFDPELFNRGIPSQQR